MGISINIQAGMQPSQDTVSVSGENQFTITATEINEFNLGNASLMSAIKQYTANLYGDGGMAPDNAWLCSPATDGNWPDLYTTYDWSQVTVSMAVQSYTVTGTSSQPQVLASQAFNNQGAGTMTCEANLSATADVSSEVSWSVTNSTEVSQNISYGVSFGGAEVGGETAFNFGESWEQGGSTSQSYSVSSGSSASYELAAGQSAVAELTMITNTVTIEITFTESLSGQTAVNYSSPYQGHHFYGWYIQDVMSAASLPSSQTVTQTVTIVYGAQAMITFTSSDGQELARFAAVARPVGPQKATAQPPRQAAPIAA